MILTVTNETGWTSNRAWDGGLYELHPVFSDANYSATISVELYDALLGYNVPATVTNIEYEGDYDVTFNGSNITISSKVDTYTNLFGESFVFLMPDDSEKVLPFNTKEKFTTIIKWNTPARGAATLNIPLTITAEAEMADLTTLEETELHTYNQEVSWAYSGSLAIFQDLLKRGTV